MGMFDKKDPCKGKRREEQCRMREEYEKKRGKKSGQEDIEEALGKIGKSAKGKGFSEAFKSLFSDDKKKKKKK